MHDRLTPYRALLILLLILLLACIAYGPGLHGGFLFDDFANLPALGESGPIDNWPAFWRYITSGIADPTGRPLTLLTFLLNAHNWPAHPLPFKCTNLGLHLINGVLLYALLLALGSLVTGQRDGRTRAAALVATALWLLHPLLVSTTLYIVQREAILPATCVLAGLLTWLHGRARYSRGQLRAGLFYSVLGLGLCTFLGVLAKANGALLPLYASLIEYVLLRKRAPFHNDHARKAYRKMMLGLAVLPSMVVLSYLAYVGLHGLMSGTMPTGRPWTIAQRLLTEPRVLLNYLMLLWVPRPFSNGLFNDQFTTSVSLWSPASTLPAIVAVLFLVIGAWRLRNRHPALALAVLFYFTAQLIESTSIPLELYYEHRNYVPAMLMFWPIGLWLTDRQALPRVKYLLMFALPLCLAWMTYVSAQVWGDVRQQALIWAQLNPNSPRAQTNAAQIEMQSGAPRAARDRLAKALSSHPDEAQLALNMISAQCMLGELSAGDMQAARVSMLHVTTMGSLFTHWFDHMLPVATHGSCPGLNVEGLHGLIMAGMQNPHMNGNGPQQDFQYMLGRIALAQKDTDTALVHFGKALDLQVRPGFALQEAAILGASGYPAEGLCLLDHYQNVEANAMPPGPGMPMLHDWVLQHQHYWPHELDYLRHQLAEDAASRQPGVSYKNSCDKNTSS
jgi:protein O-mannosyl-transferase